MTPDAASQIKSRRMFQRLKACLAALTRRTVATLSAGWPLGEQGTTVANPPFTGRDFQLISLLRVTLLLSGLLITQHLHGSLASLLLFYLAYSLVVHGLVLYRKDFLPPRLWHWLDLAWGIVLLIASGGDDSLIYLYLIYPIMLASLRQGTREGLGVTLVAAACWLLVLLTHSIAPVPDWQHVARSTGVLVILGYVIALWAGLESLQKRQLQLLGKLNRLSSQRFGSRQLITSTLGQLRDFYEADRCFAVIGGEDGPRLYSAKPQTNQTLATLPEPAEKLLCLPQRCTVVTNRSHRRWAFAGQERQIDGVTGEAMAAAERRCDGLSRMFGETAWISVPLELRGVVLGRIYLLSVRRTFGPFDISLLRQAMEKLMPLVETVTLIDNLSMNAAENERRKISIDLHDSAIQPYLGLKLGLEALRRKAEPGNALTADIVDLCRMTQDSVAELRGYVRALSGRRQPSNAPLLEGLQKQIERFRGFYGLEVTMNLRSEISLNQRLTAEVVHMVGESLSNIGRHTRSRQVTINLSQYDDNLITQIINHGADGDAPWKKFIPASLTRRARNLGGHVDVAPATGGGTEVLVSIPI